MNGDRSPAVRVVRYDHPFNFSDKCNAGAAKATGERIIFLNDDIEPQQRDWIENLIEPLENSGVGAVAPKLLYQNGTVQHAGLVTGVRGLVGTAFHQFPGDSTAHVNFIQSMRTTSAVTGACMAMRRSDFVRLDGFDAERLPILHSDFDLCFKVREAGMRCVYTPFAVLTHRGHASLGSLSEPPQRPKDKSELYFLRRWGGYLARDPYFPENMRDWLYADPPGPIQIYAKNHPDAATKGDVLLATDLADNNTGRTAFRVAVWCEENGVSPVVVAGAVDALLPAYQKAGITVVIDQLLCANGILFREFTRNFDLVITNILGSLVSRAARAEGVPVLKLSIATPFEVIVDQIMTTIGMAELEAVPV